MMFMISGEMRMMTCMTISSTNTEFKKEIGEIWLMKVAFIDDPSQFKVRPVVIVSEHEVFELEIQAAPITTQNSRDNYDVVIEDWEEAGLRAPSIARTFKAFPTVKGLLRRPLGKLTDEDLHKVLFACKRKYSIPGLVD
ncbi:type II toxin-antitoxin system PemK/MazF family toxin [Bacillus thuringiensis]